MMKTKPHRMMIFYENNEEYRDAICDDESRETGKSEQSISTRHSERERRLPRKFRDYFTGFSATAGRNRQLSTEPPCTYSEIVDREDCTLWIEAIEDELFSMKTNDVCALVKRPTSCRPLKFKWVFRVKEGENGNPVKYKARLVVKGFLQKPGMDYHEIYAPVAKQTTIRTVLAVGIQKGCYFHKKSSCGVVSFSSLRATS